MIDHSGMKLGRTAPTPRQRLRAMPITRYMTAPLPPAPIELHNADGAPIGMFGNDRYGNCTFVGVANIRAILSKLCGEGTLAITDAEVIAAYLKFTDGQDVGAVEQDVLTMAQREGIDFGEPEPWHIDAWARVDLGDVELCRQLINLFGALYLGVSLPLAAQRQELWDVGPKGTRGRGYRPGSWGGHALLQSGYDKHGAVDLVTWGMVKIATPAWMKGYADEGYVLLPRDLAIRSGIDHDQLIADINAVRYG